LKLFLLIIALSIEMYISRWEDVVYGSLKTNSAMDVLTGIYHSMGGK